MSLRPFRCSSHRGSCKGGSVAGQGSDRSLRLAWPSRVTVRLPTPVQSNGIWLFIKARYSYTETTETLPLAAVQHQTKQS